MSVTAKMRRQKAVWWARQSQDRYGRWTFSPPIEISCRWEDSMVEFLDARGETQTSKAVAYVDRELSIGDRLMEGEMDSNTPDDPMSTSSYEVRRMDALPNFKASERLLTAYLG